MGQDFSSEYPSTWQNADVLKWKQTARTALKSYYLGYEGVQWHEYSYGQRSLLTTKICFALYGLPTNVDDFHGTLENAYSASQQEAANNIKDKIIEVYNACPATNLRVGIIFISCKQQENEFLLPVFRVYVGDNNGDLSKFVDTNCRVYSSWTDWKDNNKLPMLKYCYPSRGFYTCSSNASYQFEPNSNPNVDFGTSPACDFLARIARQADVLSGVTSLGSGGIAIAAMFTPLAPVVLVGSAIAGTTAAVYGAGRSVQRLVDKGTHNECLTDLESLTCWLTILVTPAHFATAATNGVLAAGARNSGRIFSSTVRTAATILNLTTFGLDSVMIAFGLANLIEKAKNDQLTTLDVLQFSMSVFFFSHTLIQPKTASGIIEAAQNEHIAAYKNAMTDPEAQKAFQDFVDRNRGNHDMRDNSKIVRTINKIDDPKAFFKGVGDMKADIGGRKGRTIIIQDNHSKSHRVNPNRVFFDAHGNPPIDLNVLRGNLLQCFGTDLENVQIGGEYIFRNMTEHQMQRVKTVLGGTARNYNKNIVNTAQTLAQKMGYHTVDDFLSVVELVAKEVKGLKKNNLTSRLNHLQGDGQADFIRGVQCDLKKARAIASNAELTFVNDLKAVYHYRKHGNDFPTRLPDKIDFYLTDMPQKILKDANLTNINREPGGVTIKTYITSKSEFGVLVEFPNNKSCIATLFKNPQALQTFEAKMVTARANAFKPSMVGDMARRMATSMGFAAVLTSVTVGNMPAVSLDKFAIDQNNPEALQEIARILNAMTLDDDLQDEHVEGV